MRLAAWRRKSSAGLGGLELDDNDLVKALAGVSAQQLANMDEAFRLLDSGLGGVFSATMARRDANMRLQKRLRLSGSQTPVEARLSKPSPRASPSDPPETQSSEEDRQQEQQTRPRRGLELFRSAVDHFRKPKRRLAAQTAMLLCEDSLARGQGWGKEEEAMVEKRNSKRPPQPTQTFSHSQHSPDPPSTAGEGLPEDQLGELGRARLGHQLFCWRALRAEKLPLPGGRGEVAPGEAPPAPEPRHLAAQALLAVQPQQPCRPNPRPPPVPPPWRKGHRILSVPPRQAEDIDIGRGVGSPRTSSSSSPRLRTRERTRTVQTAPAGSLRHPDPVVEPHRDVASNALTGTPEFAYLRRCELRGLVPCETAWRGFGKSQGVVDVPKRTLGDQEIGAIVETAVHCAAKGHIFQVLDLGGNALSNDGLCNMADLLAKHPEACSTLTSLSLAGNTPLRLHSDGVLGELGRVFTALPALTSLDLSGVRIHGQAATKLVEALEACSKLRSLRLVGCGLGKFQESECVAIASLFRHPDLEDVDLSGNFFGCAGFAAVGTALAQSKLRRLSFSGNSCMLGSTVEPGKSGHRGARKGPNSAEEKPYFHPLQLLIEGFRMNRTLTEIDLSACGMGPDTAFVLEDALRSHSSVTSLGLAHNPFGEDGLRSVVRLLLDEASEVKLCDIAGHREADDSAARLKYCPVQPGGMYKLNMRYPQQRATLRTLLWLGEKTMESALRAFRFEPKHAKPIVEKSHDFNTWVVPTEGTFCFTYTLPLSKVARRCMESLRTPSKDLVPQSRSSPPPGHAIVPSPPPGVKPRPAVKPFHFGNHGPFHLEPVNPDRNLSVMMPPQERPDPRPRRPGTSTRLLQEVDPEQLASAMEYSWVEVAMLVKESRYTVSAIRFVLVRDMFLSLRSEDEQLRFIKALSKDMSFNSAQVLRLCQDRPEIFMRTLVALFPAIGGRAAQLSLLDGLAVKTRTGIFEAAAKYIWFQEGNVTGRYYLDLSSPADYAVAEKVLLVNAWETEVAKVIGRPDMSQRGNYEMLRNETLNDEPFTYGRGWNLPSHGWLFFDYSSARRPPMSVGPMFEMNEVPKYLKSSTIASSAKLKALRSVSVHMYMSTHQLKSIMQCFPERSEDRQELFCMLHTRVVDPVVLLGPEILLSPDIFEEVDRQSLLRRVGHLHLLNAMHPEDVQYRCHLKVYEERSTVDFLVQLAVKEPGGRVIGAASGPNSRSVLPVSWAEGGVPDEDIHFSCTYDTKTANVAWRQTLANRYTVGFSTGKTKPPQP